MKARAHFFIAPDGKNNNTGSKDAPLATLSAVQEKIAELEAETDVAVTLFAGTYYLDEPLRLRSGKHKITFQPFGYGTDEQAKVTISGGRRLTGWRLHNKERNIWRVAIGDLETRQLFINSKRIPRAFISDISGTITKTETGYKVDDISSLSWGNAEDIEFVYGGINPWSEARMGVQSIEKDGDSTVITMKQPAFEWANNLYQSTLYNFEDQQWTEEDAAQWKAMGGGEDNVQEQGYGLDRPTWVENGLGFLTEPGTFVYEASEADHHTIYYIPRPHEDMEKVEAIVPVLETLVHGAGTADEPVQNITFRGLNFAHATWLRPNSPEGFLHYHGAGYYDGGKLDSIEWSEGASINFPAESAIIPSHLTFDHARNITIENCHFAHLGASALAFSSGSSQNIIRDNTFEDISAVAITIGDEMKDELTENNVIEQNLVQNIGCEYHGSSAILVALTQHTTIAHNQVNDVPHAGIVVYGGPTARGTKITNNLIYNSMKILADGGGIYISSPQGTSEQDGMTISGNVIRDTITPYNIGLYTDYGAKWVTVENNIVYRADTPIILEVKPPLEDVIFRNNYWDKMPAGYDNPAKTVTLEDNIVLGGEGMDEAIKELPKAMQIFVRAGRKS